MWDAFQLARKMTAEILNIYSITTRAFDLLSCKQDNSIISILYHPPGVNFGYLISVVERFLKYVCKYVYIFEAQISTLTYLERQLHIQHLQLL